MKYQPMLEEKRRVIRSGNGNFNTLSNDVYFGGALLVEYIYEKFGESKILSLISSRAINWEEAIQEELNISYRKFKEDWLIWAIENY